MPAIEAAAFFVADAERHGLDMRQRDNSPLTADAVAADMHLWRDVRDAVKTTEAAGHANPIDLLMQWSERGGDPLPVAAAFDRQFAFAFRPQTPTLVVLRELAALFRGEIKRE